MKIHRPNPQILIVTKSRLANVGYLTLFILGFGIWYTILLGRESYPGLFFLLAPVVALPKLYKILKIVAVGEQFSFDGMKRAICKNNKLLARFDEVSALQVRTISDGETEEYRLTADLWVGKRSFGKIEIHTSGDLDGIIALADDVAWDAGRP